MFRGIAWLRGPACWAHGTLALAAGAVAVLSASASAPLQAAGETGTPGGPSCPSPNPPNQMTLVAGTPQSAILGAAFATTLQVALSNSDGCPVTSAAAGVPVTFSAPSSGASGVFSASASNTITVGADASGTVAAPAFTANSAAGSYTVTASSQYGSVSFSLANTAAGIPARILAIPLTSRSASVTSRYAQPLQVRVLDAGGNPIAGAAVSFTLASGVSGACGTSSSAGAGATFVGGGTEASATTGATGVAISPLFTANTTAGSFTATAAVSGKESSGGSGKENAGASGGEEPTPISFSLSNRAGKPAKLTPGVGSTQSTPAGAPLAIGLAVTVTDAEGNHVAGALITFAAPLGGASGHFTVRSRGSRHRRTHVSHPSTVRVETNACGIAVAPAFAADDMPGGYIVKASVEHARPAAFALVNLAPGRSS